MATKFTWSYDSLERDVIQDGLADVIVTSYWRITGVDLENEKYSSTVYGSAGIASPDPDDFTPFADVTEAEVKAWTLASMEKNGDQTEASLQKNIQDAIDLQKNPIQKSGTPAGWSS